MVYFWSDQPRRVLVAVRQVQDAKTRLSEVIERARTEGPQTITRHGAESGRAFDRTVSVPGCAKARFQGAPIR
ncbi:MAG: type II toxin-antitoxin system prevent-host-death family antitoxin [Stellaceae bacterium]